MGDEGQTEIRHVLPTHATKYPSPLAIADLALERLQLSSTFWHRRLGPVVVHSAKAQNRQVWTHTRRRQMLPSNMRG